MPRGVYPRTKLRGVNHYQAKLTDETVLLIRKSPESVHALAKQFGVSSWTVHDVRSGRTWAHVRPA
jgi:hypothetical protein